VKHLVLGLLAAPGVAHDLARELERELPAALARRFSGTEWTVVARGEPRAAAGAGNVDLVKIARRRMLRDGWDLAICLTDLPLHVGRRPVIAHAAVSTGVGLVSVPALGAADLERRLRQTLMRLVAGLLGESPSGSASVGELVKADERTIRFVTRPGRGNVRLLVGMVRANRPWRLASGLSRALVGALGTAAFGLASTGVWHIADGMGVARSVALCLGAVLVTCVSLIVVHELWEHAPDAGREARERVMLFNLATAITIALGVITLYVALLAIIVLCEAVLISPHVLEQELGHPVNAGDYLGLAWVVTSLATIGGALGGAVESDDAVREAAYDYRPDEESEDEMAEDDLETAASR
jgi:uncharacterized membrane protein